MIISRYFVFLLFISHTFQINFHSLSIKMSNIFIQIYIHTNKTKKRRLSSFRAGETIEIDLILYTWINKYRNTFYLILKKNWFSSTCRWFIQLYIKYVYKRISVLFLLLFYFYIQFYFSFLFFFSILICLCIFNVKKHTHTHFCQCEYYE